MDYKNIVYKYFPTLKIETENLITKGWESDLLLINNEMVFRFPKQNNRFDVVYDKEKIITDKIRPFITTPITKMVLYKKGIFKREIVFSLLDYINGVDYEISNKPDISTDLAKFLTEMHAIDINILRPFEQLNANNLPFYQYKLELNNFKFDYELLQPILKKHNLNDDFNKCIRIFSDFEWKENDNVLCHNDLHQGNVMINDDKISGIIDFGDCIYTNYNVEFISLLKWRNETILKTIEEYEKLTYRKVNLEFVIAIIKLQLFVQLVENEEKSLSKLEYYNRL